MDQFSAQRVIEQLLASNQATAGQWLQQNAAQLDDTFFHVLNAMLQQAQQAHENAWGSSFEDRLALGMARIQSGGQSNARADGLTAIRDFGWIMRMLAQASPDGRATPMTVTCPRCGQTHPMLCPGMNQHPPAPSVLARPGTLPTCVLCGSQLDHATCTCGHVVRFSAGTPVPVDPRIAEAQRSVRYGELGQRLLAARERALPGIVTPEAIAEIKSVQDGYRELLAEAEAAPPGQLHSLDDFRRRIADTEDALARAHEAMRDEVTAAEHYERAAAAYEQLGLHDLAVASRESLTAMRSFTAGEVDDEMVRLRAALDAAPANSLLWVQRLVDLAELTSRAGDHFAARDLYDTALATLTTQGHARDDLPMGTLLDAMRQTLTQVGGLKPGESPAEVFIVVRGLLSRVHIGLARVFKASDPARSSEHLVKADQLDGRDDAAAMEEARKAMGELQRQMNDLARGMAR